MRPNILFILCDQLRPDALAAAPHAADLARRGVSFANAYTASPLCQPARASIITGRYPTQHGICGNMNEPLRQEERADTFMQHLRAAGYYSALIGKHHYYDRYNVGMDVTEDDQAIAGYGFDHVWQVVDCGENLHNDDRYTRFLAERGQLQRYRHAQRERAWRGGAHPLPAPESVDGYIGERALEFLRGYEREAPFYLNVGFVGPHPPYWVPEPYDTRFAPDDVPPPKGVNDPKEVRRTRVLRANYWGKVALIDDYLGALCDVLAERGLLDDTLIVFAADHGDNLGDYGIWDKRHFFEASARVPLIVAGPGVATNPRVPGRVCRALVSSVDLYPTLLAAAGCSEAKGLPRSGLNLLDIAADRAPLRSAVYSELGTAMMVRDANWKLVYDPEQGGTQHLYDLRADPGELNNLAGMAGYETVRAGLIERLLSRLIRMTHFTHDKERQRLQRVRV